MNALAQSTQRANTDTTPDTESHAIARQIRALYVASDLFSRSVGEWDSTDSEPDRISQRANSC